jgi:HAMP domain-containing protein
LRASTEINFYVENLLKELDLTRRNVVCLTLTCTDERNHEVLQSLLDNNPSIYSASIANLSGEEVIKNDQYHPDAPVQLLNIASEEKFTSAIEGGPYVGEVRLFSSELPSVSVSVSILDKDNNKIGVLSADVDLSPLWATVRGIKMGKAGYVYVVDKQGRLLSHESSDAVKEISNLSTVEGVKNFIEGRKTAAVYTSFEGEQVMGSWAPVERVGWGVIVELPYAEVLLGLHPLLVVSIVSLIIFILSIVLLLGIVYRQLIIPLRNLKKGVSEIQGGNWKHAIRVGSEDELGDLARAFNEMGGRLEDFYKTLEEKVRGRTQELEAAQEKLQENLNDLQRTNTFMLNRELKIVDLKKEIARLKEELGLIPSELDKGLGISKH